LNKKIKEKLLKEVELAFPRAVEIRHELHRWPETGNEEFETADIIEKELTDLGIAVKRLLNTGIIGVLEGKGDINNTKTSSQTVTALRADIDALPVNEQKGLPYSSERQGYMHACGHDVHTAVLLGTARVLCNLKDEINRGVKFIFQPAEETTGGAERMIEAGCLKEPEVGCIYGLHVRPELDSGKIGVKFGRVHASSDIFRITVKGKSSHGANPESGVDALLIACQIVTNIQSIISRSVSPLDSAVITVGSIHSGNAVNIIADRAVLEGTVRTINPATRENLRRHIKDIAELTAMASGAFAAVDFIKGYDALINHEEETETVKNVGADMLGSINVSVIDKPSMGAEDFSYYLQKCRGSFFFLGSGYPGRFNPPIHSDCFEVNEDCIRTGILMLSSLVLRA